MPPLLKRTLDALVVIIGIYLTLACSLWSLGQVLGVLLVGVGVTRGMGRVAGFFSSSGLLAFLGSHMGADDFFTGILLPIYCTLSICVLFVIVVARNPKLWEQIDHGIGGV